MESRLEAVANEVILKAIQGDDDAFTEIYRTYNQRVYFMAVQYFKNEDTAKDIVQNVFIKVHTQLHTLQAPNAFSSWLHVITYRECQNLYRKKKLSLQRIDNHVEVEDFPNNNEVDIVEMVENERVKKLIMESLDTMKVSMRTVAMLRFFEGLKVQEIADIMNIPKGTVSTRISRIKRRLSADLEKKGITKNFGFAILTPNIIYEAYEAMFKRYTMNEETTDRILKVIFTGGLVTATGGISLFTKLLLGGLASATVLGGVLLLNQEDNQNEIHFDYTFPEIKIEPRQEEDIAKISNISFDDSWTNKFVDIVVETTNDNYDRIVINDVETLRIVDNGNYLLKLLKDNDVIDEQIIEISNIDRDSPTAVSKTTDEKYIFYLSDTQSGIDWDNIKHYKNGELVNEYSYNLSNNSITVINDYNYSGHELLISDVAGNILTIRIE